MLKWPKPNSQCVKNVKLKLRNGKTKLSLMNNNKPKNMSNKDKERNKC